MYLVLILGVRRMFTLISQDVFEFRLFPGEIQMESSENILILLLYYNENVWA